MNIVPSYLADKESAWSPLHYRNVSRTLHRLVEDLVNHVNHFVRCVNYSGRSDSSSVRRFCAALVL